MSVPMEPEAILQMRSHLEVMARAVRDLFTLEALDDFIRTCERADTIGPLLDPTAWMRSRDDVAVMLEHARAVRALRKVLEPAEAARL